MTENTYMLAKEHAEYCLARHKRGLIGGIEAINLHMGYCDALFDLGLVSKEEKSELIALVTWSIL